MLTLMQYWISRNGLLHVEHLGFEAVAHDDALVAVLTAGLSPQRGLREHELGDLPLVGLLRGLDRRRRCRALSALVHQFVVVYERGLAETAQALVDREIGADPSSPSHRLGPVALLRHERREHLLVDRDALPPPRSRA